MTAAKARQILAVEASASPEAVGRAYRAAVKAAHPDHGGDAERLAEVMDAHRLLLKLARVRALFTPARAPPPEPEPARPAAARTVRLTVEVEEAIFGAQRDLEIEPGRRLQIQVPAGVRTGESLRLKGAAADGADVLARIELKLAPGVRLKGGDIWLEVAAPAARLKQGQKLEVDTPRGRRAFSAPRRIEDETLVRLKGEGLPARGRHGQGDLILKLKLEPEARPGARELLKRFSARWAA